MQVTIIIEKKPGVLDPQAQAINQALSSLGFDDLQDVKMGKQITVSIDTDDEERARYRAAKMCEALLANTVIETYTIEINEPS
ncbi:phosphoribosylformylglycinamidine synthase subunit PurS [Alphaproteobacteria bacterium]|jgi:phosphoribosylformylglycinamidine synthase subunit PurS|nr:phosphoribosylformylglycinamidine synthase subunit PurS [Alphaproteobacteria bacterium]MDA9815967.1 phosphoribosylformylglycinamidine synthase subunit PurS [Alphaproteobacteria bacterium]MDC0394808.1 phosphoribosylformylglycinamidine synthase subunit PurS [Alphaproteobacteria bacterium]MDC0461484.1 phosphoribosylformylglycinamidine synthase subunit PurS [Alphaproteobacteria bacterium]